MKESLLWEIRSQDRLNTYGYLFGTIHVSDSRVNHWVELAKTYISYCEVFASEFDFEEIDEEKGSALLQAISPDTLDNTLSRQSWKNFERYADQHLGIPAKLLIHQHPMMLQSMLTRTFTLEDAGGAMDKVLYEHAKTLDIETTGLESFEFQLELMAEIPYDTHLKNLEYFLKNYNRYRKRIRKMIDRYAEGRLQQLYKSASRDIGGMRQELAYNRNHHMADRFRELALEKPLFCAVGAAHLPGEKGMLRILKKMGMHSRPVQMEMS